MELLWMGLGFAAFGFLIGTTAGLSSAELTTTLLGLLFALIGGSVGALIAKLDANGRKLAGTALLAFSITATLGLYSGIYIRINDLLREGDAKPVASGETGGNRASADDYLKSQDTSLARFLQLEVMRERKSLDEACQILREQGDAQQHK